jgi:hypothetical protein
MNTPVRFNARPAFAINSWGGRGVLEHLTAHDTIPITPDLQRSEVGDLVNAGTVLDVDRPIPVAVEQAPDRTIDVAATDLDHAFERAVLGYRLRHVLICGLVQSSRQERENRVGCCPRRPRRTIRALY